MPNDQSQVIRDLKNQVELLKNALQNTLSPRAVIDANLNIVFVNSKWSKVYGYREDEVFGKTLKLITKGKDFDQKFYNAIHEAQENGFSQEIDCVHKSKSGDDVYAVVKAVCLRDNDEISGYTVLFHDMTRFRAQSAQIQLRDKVLSLLNSFAHNIMISSDWQQNVAETLEKMGEAIQVSRVYVFRTIDQATGVNLCSQVHEWVDTSKVAPIPNQEMQNVNFNDMGCFRWQQILSQGRSLIGNTSDFPHEEQAVLRSRKVKSTMSFPVMVQGKWWGFIGFDDCESERTWTSLEQQLAEGFADMLGSSIAKKLFEQNLIAQKDELERLNKLMVGRELKMIELKKEIKELKAKCGQN